MVRRAQVLTDKQVRSIHRPDLHAVGGPVPGLALQVTAGSGGGLSRSWVLRVTVGGRRQALGLDSYPLVTLAGARAKAEGLRRELLGASAAAPASVEPAAANDAKPSEVMTFKAAATTELAL